MMEQAKDREKTTGMSTANPVGINEKRSLSCGRGRGRRTIPQTATLQGKNDTSGSKSESQSKIVAENNQPAKVSRGRGSKSNRRPDKAIYVPKALRRENLKENADNESTRESGRKNETCRLTNRDNDIFTDSDESLIKTHDQLLSRHCEAKKSDVSIAPDEVKNRQDTLNDEGTEAILQVQFNRLPSSAMLETKDTKNEQSVTQETNSLENSAVRQSAEREILETLPACDSKMTGISQEEISECLSKLNVPNDMYTNNSTSLDMNKETFEDFSLLTQDLDLKEKLSEKDKTNEEHVEKQNEKIDSILSTPSNLEIENESLTEVLCEDVGKQNRSSEENTLEKQDDLAMRESLDSVDQIQVTDTCQSTPPVKPCAEGDNTQEEKNAFDNQDVIENIIGSGADQQIQVFDTCQSTPPVKSCAEGDNTQEEQNAFDNQDVIENIIGSGANQQIQVIDTCQSTPPVKPCAEGDNTQEEQNAFDNQDVIENIIGSGADQQIQVIDTCQSTPPVKSCAEGDNTQEEQNAFDDQDVIENIIGSGADQQIQVIDTCQSTAGDSTQENEKQIPLEKQDNQEIVVGSAQQTQMIDTCQSCLVLEKFYVEGVQKEKNELLEKQDQMVGESIDKDKQTRVTDICQSLRCNIEENSGVHAKGDLRSEDTLVSSKEGNSGVHAKGDLRSEDTLVSSKEGNSGVHAKGDLRSEDTLVSSKEDVSLEADSKTDEEIYDSKYAASENSINCVNHVSKNIEDEPCGNSHDEENGLCCKSVAISEGKGSIVEEGDSKVMENRDKNELLNESNDESSDLCGLTTVATKVGKPEPVEETLSSFSSGGNTGVLGVKINDEVKTDSDALPANEKKMDDKETKPKKKGKKKKGVEVEPKDEKKKKKSKKKENDNEELKDKKKDDKTSKVKTKGKKKATKEVPDVKQPVEESNHKEKTKNKKEEKHKDCSGDNDDNNDDDESWESKFNEDGECLDPELLQELTELTGIKKPSKRKTQFDYYSLPSKEVALDDDSGYGHIVEMYDFSHELKTQDLAQSLASFKDQGYEIKWVDDTHALAVFCSEIAAKQAIQMCCSPIIKLRPISQGTTESKNQAKRCSSIPEPYKPRPQTTNLAAHRLVTGALGVRSTMSKEERQKEREKLKEAKEQKRQEKQRKAEIWGD